MQTLHILTSEELAELQEIVDDLYESRTIFNGDNLGYYVRYKNNMERIAAILGLEVKDG